MKIFESISQEKILAVVRITCGLLLVYHGQEVFDPNKMNEYAKWEIFNRTFGETLAYLGKGAEFVAGVCWVLGILVRPASMMVIVTFLYITFFIGHGKFWYEDQHPFMFLLFGILYLFIGSGNVGIFRFLKKNNHSKAS